MNCSVILPALPAAVGIASMLPTVTLFVLLVTRDRDWALTLTVGALVYQTLCMGMALRDPTEGYIPQIPEIPPQPQQPQPPPRQSVAQASPPPAATPPDYHSHLDEDVYMDDSTAADPLENEQKKRAMHAVQERRQGRMSRVVPAVRYHRSTTSNNSRFA